MQNDEQEIRQLTATWMEASVATPAGGEPVTREGYTLSILRKENGKWLLARDANMLAPVQPPP